MGVDSTNPWHGRQPVATTHRPSRHISLAVRTQCEHSASGSVIARSDGVRQPSRHTSHWRCEHSASGSVEARCDFVKFGSRFYKPLAWAVVRRHDTSTITTRISLLSITTHIALLAHLSETHRLGVFETAPKFHKFTPESHWIRQCGIDSARRRSWLPASLVAVRVQ